MLRGAKASPEDSAALSLSLSICRCTYPARSHSANFCSEFGPETAKPWAHLNHILGRRPAQQLQTMLRVAIAHSRRGICSRKFYRRWFWGMRRVAVRSPERGAQGLDLGALGAARTEFSEMRPIWKVPNRSRALRSRLLPHKNTGACGTTFRPNLSPAHPCTSDISDDLASPPSSMKLLRGSATDLPLVPNRAEF